MCSFIYFLCVFTGYPSLRIEKNDLRSVTLMEAKAKVKDIAISRDRVTLQDVLHEGISLPSILGLCPGVLPFSDISRETRVICAIQSIYA